jgi:predicted RNA-binding Zn-ribbon protein involved in translation (DUF1610 family)
MYFFPYVRREWTVYRCPNGHTVARELEHVVRLGDPNVRCPKCGLVTRVDAYREWADLTPKQRRGVVIGDVLAVVFAGSALGIALGAVIAMMGLLAGLPDDTLIVLSSLAFLVGVCVPAVRQSALIRASKRRSAAREGAPVA